MEKTNSNLPNFSLSEIIDKESNNHSKEEEREFRKEIATIMVLSCSAKMFCEKVESGKSINNADLENFFEKIKNLPRNDNEKGKRLHPYFDDFLKDLSSFQIACQKSGQAEISSLIDDSIRNLQSKYTEQYHSKSPE